MSFLPPTEEQLALRATLRSFFAERWPEPELRRVAASESGHDARLWQTMADELGLQGLAIPEQYGGGGFDFADLLVVFEEMGRALVSGPFFASVAMAAPLLQALGPDPLRDELLGAIASGSRVVTVAVCELPSRWDPQAIAVTADGTGEMRTLTGAKLFVLDGVVADVLLVVARTEEGVGVLAVEPGADGLRIEPMHTIDSTRRQARIALAATPARLIAPGHDAAPAVASMCQHAAVAMAAEQVGGAQRVLEMAVAYAKVREQFGRRIGGFQAIKHQLADLLVVVEAARAALAHAVAAWPEGDRERTRASSVAKAFCSEAFVEASDRNIHVHGGIGFTWEHPAHLFYKRAVSGKVLLGSPRQHREIIATDLLTAQETS